MGAKPSDTPQRRGSTQTVPHKKGYKTKNANDFAVPHLSLQKISERVLTKQSSADSFKSADAKDSKMSLSELGSSSKTHVSAFSRRRSKASSRSLASAVTAFEHVSNPFTNEHGGMLSIDGKEIYYLGIIDILQLYNKRKKLENVGYRLIYDEYT